ncbi:MAG: VWA domain-containing protein [Spirochaetes bacterium]|nr:VWA domain-containing protein [Spirochaetota bacterium]
MKKYIFLCIFLAVGQLLWAGAKAEPEAAPERAKYLVGKGIIIPPEEIHEESYVASVDYNYPEPDSSFGVRFYSGHKQISTGGQEELFIIGIQGRRLTFEDLPPMNQAFVIDRSGSMYQRDKMEWVKESFDVFINKVRDKDFVSLVVFDEDAEVIFPATQMNSEKKRKKFRDAVHSITPGGGTNMAAGLELGYKEVLLNFNKENTNQVLFLTDGVGDSERVLELAETYRKMGIDISAIGLGMDFNHAFMSDLAKRGGGSSRFIADRETMEEIFDVGLSRMSVTVARDIELELEFLQNLEIVNTWGYDYQVEGQWDSYESGEGELSAPFGIAGGPRGNIYVVDNANNRIQKFDSSGNFITRWGGLKRRRHEGESDGKFYKLEGVAVDSNGYVYVTDTGNNRIQKFDSSGNFITKWGFQGQRKGGFRSPSAIAVDSKGYVYVADVGNNRIQKFDSDGNFITLWGTRGTGAGQFNIPSGVAIDAYRNIYVADFGNRRVQIFESDGTYITQWSIKGRGKGDVVPAGIEVDSSGNVYIADTFGKQIQKFDNDGNFISGWGSFGKEDGRFNSLTGIALDSRGNIYAADANNHRIQKFDTEGIFILKKPIRYFLSGVNLGDYETIVIHTNIPKQKTEGTRNFARLKVTYTDLDGKKAEMSPIVLKVRFVPMERPVEGISDATVLKAGTMLHYAQALKMIGTEYYGSEIYTGEAYRARIRNIMRMTDEIKKEVLNARRRLGNEGFEDELAILEKYMSIFGEELDLRGTEITELFEDEEMTPVSDDRDIYDHLNNLFQEMVLDLESRKPGNIAVTPFTLRDGRSAQLVDLINKTAESVLVELNQFNILERELIDEILEEQELSLADLIETDRAIEVGELLSVDYILTGTIIEMRGSLVIFSRVINVETAAIESVGQVIVPRDEKVNAML